MSNRVLRSALRYNEERQAARAAADQANQPIRPVSPNIPAEHVPEADIAENENVLPLHAPVMFPNGYVLFQNKDFKLVIKKTTFKHQRNFSLR